MKALTPATKQLLAPIDLKASDRLRLTLDRDGIRFQASVYAPTSFNEYGLASYPARNLFFERVPERRKLEGGMKWLLAATDTTVQVINALWPREQIDFVDEDTEIAYDYLLLSGIQQDRNVEAVANFKITKMPPNGISHNTQFPLAGYQLVPTKNAIQSEGYALFMEQGTGKTPVVIAVTCNEAPAVHAKEKRMYRVLIVCPLSVRSNWIDEYEKFATCHGKVTALRGGEVKRVKQLIDALAPSNGEEFTVVVMSYETMARMAESLATIEWDLVALDEGHYIKRYETKRAKGAMIIRDSAKKRMILTGTPIANTPLDIYSQLEFLGKGWSGFMSWKNFKSFYGVWEKTQHGDKLVALQNMPFMKERLARLSYIVTKKEVLPDLPDKVYDVYEVEMTKRQKDVYEELRRSLMLQAEQALNDTSKPRQLVVQNVLTQLLRLSQITSGFVSWDPVIDPDGNVLEERELEFFNPNPKLDALVEIMKEKSPNDKTIIWAHWVPDIRAIHARLTHEGIKGVMYYGSVKQDDRETNKHAFNKDDSVKYIAGSAGSGGAGLNLLGYDFTLPEDQQGETNANHVIYYSQDWSHPKRSQSEDRAHRRGTREPVRYTDLVVPGTIDEEIRARVLKKRMMAFEVSDVREILSNVLKGDLDFE